MLDKEPNKNLEIQAVFAHISRFHFLLIAKYFYPFQDNNICPLKYIIPTQVWGFDLGL